MINKNFILHLILIENIGPAVIKRILERSDISVSDLYSFSQTDWMHTFGFSEGTAEKLVDGLAHTKNLEEELALIEKHNIEWVTFEDDTYPHLLKNIYLPPAVLYVMGSSLQTYEKQKLLAVVGARKANDYGQRVVDALIPELVAADYTIVSGGALGIDAMAHAATLQSGGKTVAVLGSGLLQPYPSSNKKLFVSIVENGGALVSSFPLNMQALSGHFPARNRIVTGLSHGCLVVQAAQKSGALISADYAMEQGREVFAIPGPIGDELSAGCNALIQKGAKLVTSAADILEEFGDRVIVDNRVIQEKAMQMSLESAIIPAKKIVDKYSHYSSQQKLIITACKQPISFDDIIIKTQCSPELLQSELFNLQLDGVLSQDFTGMWIQH
ncbi:MAG TPA: DNA-processing protein DprA [Candidatus Babeliales bacterium]|jgi:DNA processing protein|nr:DNA-processing protein DprA [Candidatus Babeliales bacterium]